MPRPLNIPKQGDCNKNLFVSEVAAAASVRRIVRWAVVAPVVVLVVPVSVPFPLPLPIAAAAVEVVIDVVIIGPDVEIVARALWRIVMFKPKNQGRGGSEILKHK